MAVSAEALTTAERLMEQREAELKAALVRNKLFPLINTQRPENQSEPEEVLQCH